jgi:protein-S-isoprenylcysteine O-methyltransferase Ste14
MIGEMGLSPLFVFLSVAAFGLLHSLLASLAFKALAQRWLGRLAGRFYRAFFNLLAVLSLLPALLLAAVLPDRVLYTIHAPWVYLTLAVQGLALIALAVGVGQTGLLSFSGVSQLLDPTLEEGQKLVTDGLYRWVRHPLYTASLVLIWLLPRMSANSLAFNLGATLYILVGAIFEERKLIKAFGRAYADYRRRTPMLVPGLRLPHRS